LPLESTAVRARVNGPVADVEVEQRFKNDTDAPIEAVYLFPLPHEASVYKLSFRIGDRTVVAVVKEKEEAKRAYAQALREGRAATLLEQDKPSVFTLSVANVPPGETIVVELGYQDRVAFDGEWRFAFPLVAEERWDGVPPASPGDTVVRAPRPRTDGRAADVTLEVLLHAAPGMQLPRSLSHRVTTEPLGEGAGAPAWRVRLAESGTMPNRDFVLAWRPETRGVRPEIWFERQQDRPGTFLLVVTPPAPDVPDAPREAVFGSKPGEGRAVLCGNCGGTVRGLGEIKDVTGIGPAWRCTWCGVVSAVSRSTAEVTVGLPRDVVFLVDRSASMRDGSVAQAGRAVKLVMEHLAPSDAVQVIAFDHERVAMDEQEPYLPVGPTARTHVDMFFATLGPRGGSELEAAFERAAAIPVRKGRAKLVVLLTDAAVGDEARLLRRTREILDDGTRLYVLGVGPSVNRWLVERLARAGGGASDVLLPTEDVETVGTRFARRVRHGGPVLRRLRLAWEDALSADVYPSPIPDLFGGQTVQLIGRYSGSGPSRLVLTGETAMGAPFRQEIDVTLPDASSSLPGAERVWARARIEARLDQLIEDPSRSADVRLEVIGLALKHSLVSPYTSLVAEDSEKVVDAPAKRVEISASPSRDILDEERSLPREAEAGLGARPMAGAAFGPSDVPRAAPPAAPAMMAAMPPPGGMARSRLAEPAAAPPRASSAPHRGSPPSHLAAPTQPPPEVPPLLQQATTSEAYSPEELAWAKARPMGELDLVFLVDETGSMGAYIAQVQRHLLALIDALRAAPLCRSLRIGVVGYRDHPPQDPTFASRVVPLTDDIAAVRAGVERMEARGGGDGPESVTDGLYDLVRLDWRPRAARVVVWVGDAPPHGIGCPGDGFPKGCPCGHHWYTQAESCREMGIVIHAVACLPTLASFPGGEEMFKTVARTARGLYLPLRSADVLVPLITGVAETELDKQRIEERIAEVLREHEASLRVADDQERVRFVTDVLRQGNLRPRGVVVDASSITAPPPLVFRELTRGDVEEGLDRLRRLARTEL
jgi:Ca-activated chloride channel family protein